MDAREERGLVIAATCRISHREDGSFTVPSQSGKGAYRVCLTPPSPDVPMCTCPDYEERGQPCKHVHAVRYVVKRETNADGSMTIREVLTLSQTTTVAPRKT